MTDARRRPLPKRECICGRVVAVQFENQRHGGGKARVRHLCPHGNRCIFGTPFGRQGHNVNRLCRDCVADEIAARRP